ncbi:MAG TPA: GNAT family protein [bacterium]|nr:GNAT family protein [bacterium]
MLSGKLISLRPVSEEDLPIIVRHINDYSQLGPHLPFRFRTLHELKKMHAENGMLGETTGSFAVLDKSESIVGWFAYFPTTMYVKGLEVGGRILRADDWGKGYGTEVVRLIAAYLFHTKEILRVQVCFNTTNPASRRIAEKAGFTAEGVMRHAYRFGDRPVDMEVWSMVRDECPPLHEVALGYQAKQ